MTDVARCASRTKSEVCTCAENAAIEGLYFKPFFNSLQAQTAQKLSPEIRAYAEMCHEKKLVELVISSLNTCIAAEQGKKKAEAILRSTHSVNIQQKWKPLLEECHQHLRDNRKGTSDLHLAILSERWNTSDQGREQAKRLEEIVAHLVNGSIHRSNGVSRKITECIDREFASRKPNEIRKTQSNATRQNTQMHNGMKDQALGIHLGAAYSRVAWKNGSNIEVFENGFGNKKTPCVVHFGNKFKTVGEGAQAMIKNDRSNTVYGVMNFMGRSVHDPEIMKYRYPFEIIPNEKGEANIRVHPYGGEPKLYSPAHITSLILSYMKVVAKAHIGSEIANAVITVPSSFNIAQRQATKDAGEMSGFNVLRIINEPIAMAISYISDKNFDKWKIIMIYNLGVQSFDVHILRCRGLFCEILSSSGLEKMGGEDFDHRLNSIFHWEVRNQGRYLSKEEDTALMKICEEAKIALSQSDRVIVPYFANGIRREWEITREIFEDLTMDLFEKTIECVKEAIAESWEEKEAIDDVVLVGGSCQIPIVRRMICEFFGDKQPRINFSSEHAIARGAAILAERIFAEQGMKKVAVIEILPFSLGIEIGMDNKFHAILKRNTAYPISKTDEYLCSADEGSEIVIKIFEGEHPLCKDNKFLGVCRVPVQAKSLTFSVNVQRVLIVHVKFKDTGKEVSTTVQTNRFTEEEPLNVSRSEEENVRRMTDVAKCNSRSKSEVCLCAENAASEGLYFKPFFNSLQAQTARKLSQEIRAYAEMCHEKKLVELVISSLNTCIAVEQGKKKAEAILRSTHSVNIQQKWKPLLEECHQHLRDNSRTKEGNKPND
ncbi:hypothetical protein PRIPAC_70031 [Pristionchus pacificus]|uniref:Uncharacterized protein n=1 Tax=Pristionchus pacificus TaxID=54126 RepID=A0A2A6CFC6_PRIPA|nr:hypothetical protein PRIPAC_70031 [Pristionchus pacificus]|eukprot:PDM76788.1 hypothetical protein PRIPAC_42183 [Pristionchus pacificus]